MPFWISAELEDHINDTTNPHGVTAAQAGADPSGSAATVQTNLDTHEADVANPHVVTAAQAGADPSGSAATVQGNLDNHEADVANPHVVTAAQAGADPSGSASAVQGNLDTHEADVANPHVVTAAQAGADPSGSASAVQGNLDTHEADVANPHVVTAAQAGAAPSVHTHVESDITDLSHDAVALRGVSINVAAATPVDGKILVYRDGSTSWVLEDKPAGGSNPALNDLTDVDLNVVNDIDILAFDSSSGNWINQTVAALGIATDADLTAHINDTTNPHVVTAAQTGADPSGSADAVQSNLDTHEADVANPHVVTAAQAGADPSGSAAMVQGNLDTHEANVANPHNVTPGQLGVAKAQFTGMLIGVIGTAIPTGIKGSVRIPYDATIKKVTVLAEKVGSIEVDVWKVPYANHPATAVDSIVAAAPPKLVNAVKSEDEILTGWTTNVTAGDVMTFSVTSVAVIEAVSVLLDLSPV